ncbi:MAG: cupin domain-containing protein, partial [Caldiserica bacterium]|nr:cupin domain-containing protein [Caldisericota bacterium]
EALPERYGAERQMGTAIYYLLTASSVSPLHRLKSDEVFHFYLGDPVIMLKLFPEGKGEVVTLGNNLSEGEIPQTVVPAGVWQGMYIKKGGAFALLGTTVSPGFEYADYEEPAVEKLFSRYPEFREEIKESFLLD